MSKYDNVSVSGRHVSLVSNGERPPSLDYLPQPPEWTLDALCAQTDPDAFFPEKGGSTRDAKRICASCDVKAECLAYALEHDQRFGIWGGKSERERRKLKPAGSRAAKEAERDRLLASSVSSATVAVLLGLRERTVIRLREQLHAEDAS